MVPVTAVTGRKLVLRTRRLIALLRGYANRYDHGDADTTRVLEEINEAERIVKTAEHEIERNVRKKRV